ncbi:MAG: Tetratricopeptide repeat [Herbinix sp.]|nr:Tetratricopeptide repeat [Herbinix sp.]
MNDYTNKDFSCTLLKLERIKQNKGQKEVCHGICVPSYLSKIERNQVNPDRYILKQLFQRLGIDFYFGEEFMKNNQALIDRYFEQLSYGLERSAYVTLQQADKELSYSPLALDWLIIQAYEENKEAYELLSKCQDNMSDQQRAYYYMLLPIEKGSVNGSLNLYIQAYYILNNSYSLFNLMLAYFMKGKYDKVQEYTDKCISHAIEEGNTFQLASCYEMVGSVYACLNVVDLMMPFYNRAIHLLQNTYWNKQMDGIYYNIGATYVSVKKYDLAMHYLNMVTWEDNFLLSHKKALAMIRSGQIEAAEMYLKQMEEWLHKHESEKAQVVIEKMMLEEARYECDKDFLDHPKYIELLEAVRER